MTFSALASIAAIGTGQRSTLPPSGALGAFLPMVDEADPQATAYSLLDAAAASTVVRRGTLPVSVGEPVGSAAADALPEPPAQVVSLLTQLLADETGLIRLSADRVVVLTEALGLVAAAGMRLPYRTLPAALARQDLRASVRPVLGARGEWLLGQLSAVGLGGGDATSDHDDAEVWEIGTSDQRLAWFWARRAADADGARALAEAVWKESAAAFRTDLLRAIVATVVPSDEPFLEGCLEDRAEGVRVFGREGLARLPESAYVARMVVRARSCVAVVDGEQSALSRLVRKNPRMLLLTPPVADAAGVRDGITPKLSSADALNTLIAAIPPSLWPTITGAGVGELATLPQDEPRTDIRPGLVAAIVRNHDAIAATNLVRTGFVDPHLIPLLEGDLLAAVVRSVPTEQVAAVIAPLPTPWHPDVATQVGSRLLSSTSHQLGPEVWTAFARGVPVRQASGWAQRLRSLGEPDGPRNRAIMRDTISVLTVRALIGDALRPFLPEAAWQDPQTGATPAQEGRP